MPINELMKLSNNFRQLLFSLPRALIRITYLFSIQTTFAVEVRILEGHGEDLHIILAKKNLQNGFENFVKYSHTA